jgi:hypothetical protein
MSQGFRISVEGKEAEARMRKIKRKFTQQGVDRVVRKVAWVTHRRLVTRTPKKWTGHTRRSWRVFRRGTAHYSVTNRSKVMIFLEKGTRAHGPKRAKFLFIPLTRKAALAGARKVVGNEAFKPGRHFVLAKRVRGIKALRIVEQHRPFARITLKSEMRLHIRRLLASP